MIFYQRHVRQYLSLSWPGNGLLALLASLSISPVGYSQNKQAWTSPSLSPCEREVRGQQTAPTLREEWAKLTLRLARIFGEKRGQKLSRVPPEPTDLDNTLIFTFGPRLQFERLTMKLGRFSTAGTLTARPTLIVGGKVRWENEVMLAKVKGRDVDGGVLRGRRPSGDPELSDNCGGGGGAGAHFHGAAQTTVTGFSTKWQTLCVRVGSKCCDESEITQRKANCFPHNNLGFCNERCQWFNYAHVVILVLLPAHSVTTCFFCSLPPSSPNQPVINMITVCHYVYMHNILLH